MSACNERCSATAQRLPHLHREMTGMRLSISCGWRSVQGSSQCRLTRGSESPGTLTD